MLVILSTVPSFDEGEDLSRKIIDIKLAACVQILPKVTSIYFWEGKVQKEDEHLLLIKTLPEKYEELEAFINENHSYDVPEIIAIESSNVSSKYREWLENYLR
ncbi:MAG TPA: divalent-cation tolerance protein CutA [Pyrinomonadaceae bacterium]|nr:divalent-cation tolerance protein CutA [Pyrinomonadaceae bacterium]